MIAEFRQGTNQLGKPLHLHLSLDIKPKLSGNIADKTL
jgi:hypothetical protein